MHKEQKFVSARRRKSEPDWHQVAAATAPNIAADTAAATAERRDPPSELSARQENEAATLRLCVDFSSGFVELGCFLFKSLFDCFRIRQPANLALLVTFNVIYPIASGQSRHATLRRLAFVGTQYAVLTQCVSGWGLPRSLL